jgi:3'-phosphoadenosine 5'-phosphosulfate sulfotransferase (PAPS reductase)/FAD synthetase
MPTEILLAQRALQAPSSPTDASFSRPLLNKNAISQINARIKALPVDEQPMETLKWAAHNLPGRWAQVTSFGTSGIVLAHMIGTLDGADRVPVVTIDTLHLFPETYALVEEARRFFRLEDRLRVYRTRDASTRAQFEAAFGPYLWRADPPLYDYVTKVGPPPQHPPPPLRHR